MDPSLIRKALEAIRGGGQAPAAAPQQAAPSAVQPGADMAYGQMPAPAMQPATPSPFQLDKPAEQLAQANGTQTELEPIMQQILKHLGMLNVIRNQANQTVNAGYQE